MAIIKERNEKKKENVMARTRRYGLKGSPVASATYYCFDHRATMAAILDMRKYPPHCPRPSTNSPIHPRADSTLQPAALRTSAPRVPRFDVPPSRSYPAAFLPACLPACHPTCHPHVLSKTGPTPLYEQRGSLLLFRLFFSFYISCDISHFTYCQLPSSVQNIFYSVTQHLLINLQNLSRKHNHVALGEIDVCLTRKGSKGHF